MKKNIACVKPSNCIPRANYPVSVISNLCTILFLTETDFKNLISPGTFPPSSTNSSALSVLRVVQLCYFMFLFTK